MRPTIDEIVEAYLSVHGSQPLADDLEDDGDVNDGDADDDEDADAADDDAAGGEGEGAATAAE